MNQGKGQLFVVSAPAGTGKTTLVDMLQKEFPWIVRSISYTTRKPRGQEVDGVDYFFVDQEQFEQMQKDGEFIESAEVFGNLYGTSRKKVQEILDQGRSIVLVIDTQGAAKIRGQLDSIFIFILPPSLSMLEKRLRKRRTESEEEIQKRLFQATDEMKRASSYDYTLVNDDLEKAYQRLRSIILSHTNRKA